MRQLENVQFRSKAASPLAYVVGIPLTEALLASLGGSVIVGLLNAWLFGAGAVGALTAAGGAFALLTAVLLTLRFGKAVLYSLEAATGLDIDQDGEVGEPEPRFIYVRNGKQPIAREQRQLDDLRAFVEGCYTRGVSRRAWTGCQLPGTGHTVTRGTWQRYTDAMLKAGVLEETPTGRELTCDLDEALDILEL